MVHRLALILAVLSLGIALEQAAAQVRVVQAQAAPNQAEIRKKLIDATKDLAESLKALAKMEAAAADIKAEVEAARNEAETLRAEVARLNRQLLDAATAQAAIVRGGPRGGIATQERENADPQDPYERIALLTPGGPVVMQVALTINGQPFRTIREKLIDEMLAAADKDKDGQVTWVEAIRSPRFTMGRLQLPNQDREVYYTQSLDKNRDRLVDRSEVRLFVAQYFGAPTFSLGGYGTAYGGFAGNVVLVNGRVVASTGAQADVRALLDSDADGALSAEEIAAASERLKSRDADDNDLLYPQEFNGGGEVQGRVTDLNAQRGQPVQTAILLGPVASAEGIFGALSQYKTSDGEITAASFPAIPGLFAALDKNEDGKLQQDEVLALNDVQPQIELTADIGSPEAKGLTLKTVAGELTTVSQSADNTVLELPGVRLSLSASRVAPQTVNYEQQAGAYLSRFDADKNGYLEKSELPENVYQQVAMWDENEDGKIYAAEITASYARQAAPLLSQVVADVANQGNSLFQALDQTGDGRLSLREMRVASQQILALDKDQDGQISLREIPATYSVTFGLGNAGYRYQAVARPGAAPAAAQPAGPNAGPEWFQRMDRNADGDVTLKEFLGDEAEFKQLDTNADGFIEAKEAAAVEAAK